MASDQSFAEYVAEQMSDAGTISFRKMFGEYGIYCDGKVVALVCDNRLFVKCTDAGVALLSSFTEGFPYPGAKPWILGDDYLDDEELLARLIRVTAAALPVPKPKKAAKKKSSKTKKR